MFKYSLQLGFLMIRIKPYSLCVYLRDKNRCLPSDSGVFHVDRLEFPRNALYDVVYSLKLPVIFITLSHETAHDKGAINGNTNA